MTQAKGFLDNAYKIAKSDDSQKLYDLWADTYDRELLESGYITPQRIAEIMLDLEGDKSTPILDIGCGTGLSGNALSCVGFNTIDGTDFNESMLEIAQGTNYYRNLFHGDASKKMIMPADDYKHAIAAGVIAIGLIPAHGIGVILDILPIGGVFVFSLNDHTLEDTSYEKEIDRLVEEKIVEVLVKEHGQHIIETNLGAVIYALRKI